jgi:hypothetical protein
MSMFLSFWGNLSKGARKEFFFIIEHGQMSLNNIDCVQYLTVVVIELTVFLKKPGPVEKQIGVCSDIKDIHKNFSNRVRCEVPYTRTVLRRFTRIRYSYAMQLYFEYVEPCNISTPIKKVQI